MPDAPLYNKEAKVVGKVDLDEEVFNGKVNRVLLHQAMVMYAQNRRIGTASTKTRKDVRGGGRKPWRQKGTGRARAGTIRSPLWRGGGVVFGPHPRDYSYSLPKGMRRRALISALNSKLDAKELIVVEKIQIDSPKTKELVTILSRLDALDRPLILSNDLDLNIVRASQNLSGVAYRTPCDLNAYDILRHRKLIISKDALKTVMEILAK